MTRASALWVTSAFYAALFLGLGAHLPFWPIWLSDWGLTDAEIGQMLGTAIFARIFGSTLVPSLADRYAIRRFTIAATAALSAIVILLHLAVATKAALFALTIAMALFSGGLIPTGEALGLRASQTYGFTYAHPRAVGSAAFLLVVLALGFVIDRFGPNPIPLVIIAALIVTGCLGMWHPGGGAAPSALDRASPRDTIALFRNRVFWIFATAFAFGQAAHGVFYTYSALHWREAGLSGQTIGALWSVGVVAEIVLMFVAGRAIVAWLGPTKSLIVAATAGVLRWSAMLSDPPLWMLWPLQSLHALTFALSLLAGMAFIAEAVPRRLAATAQGVTTGLIGGSMMAVITIASGFAAPVWPPESLYWIAVIPAAAGLMLCALLDRLWQREPLSV
ncbi:MAG: MFS transporter [Pseudomonadota bacterium]